MPVAQPTKKERHPSDGVLESATYKSALAELIELDCGQRDLRYSISICAKNRTIQRFSDTFA